MAKVRSLENVQFSRYLCLCNVLRICNIRAIPTYRVYRLYDSTSVTRAPPYTKHIGRMKYLAMKNPRQEKSIADHVDVCDRDQASQRYTADRCYHVV